MAVCYDRLWKILIDQHLQKKDLIELVGISSNALAKMGKEEDVSTSVLSKICKLFECEIEDIIEIDTKDVEIKSNFTLPINQYIHRLVQEKQEVYDRRHFDIRKLSHENIKETQLFIFKDKAVAAFSREKIGNVTPFVKWAGGKKQLLSRLVERMPATYGNYYEPFIGGGALLFDVLPQNGCINDINKELIHTYTTIRNYPKELIAQLTALDKQESTEEFYLAQRELFNYKILNRIYDIEMAALFIYINKHCFNGLYRVNQKGLFNVPWNKKVSGMSFLQENILNASRFLKNIKITCNDFEAAVSTAKPGDFIFFDSPYAPLKPTSFASYTKTGFEEKEHRRLAELFKRLTERGCYCMLTNHNTPLIRELYADYNVEEVDVKRAINVDATKRTGKEVIIRNY